MVENLRLSVFVVAVRDKKKRCIFQVRVREKKGVATAKSPFQKRKRGHLTGNNERALRIGPLVMYSQSLLQKGLNFVAK